MEQEADVLAGVFAYPRLMLARGEGCWVWDTAGKRYLDFTAGLGVLALGHGRAEVAEIIKEQYLTLAHCSNLFVHAPALDLATRLKEASFAARLWFANSGAEANEAALKFARLYGRAQGGPTKHRFLAFHQGFHGRTMGSLSVTHEPAYRAPFAPLLDHDGGVRFAPFNDVAQARAAMDDSICGVIVEPVQGEGGVMPATPAFLQALRQLCDQHHAQLIFDEVQCGLGRVGELFAYTAYGVVPDMLTLAKPLAAGLPLGAVLIGDAMAALLQPGQHGSTFGGGPVTCKVACHVFDTVQAPAFLAAVRHKGARLQTQLAALCGPGRVFKEARGMGLMRAVVVADPARHKPADIVSLAREHGLLITRAGADAIRFLPPLVCTDADIDAAMDVFRTLEGVLACQ